MGEDVYDRIWFMNVPKGSNSNKPVAMTTLGRMRDEVVGEMRNLGKDTAKAVVQEPKKILEQILGGKPNTGDERGDPLEQAPQGGSQQDPQKIQQQAQLLQKKQMEDQKKRKDLLRLHRQRLKEEEDYFRMKQKQEEQQKQMEEQKEEEEEKSEIVQLQRERQKSEQLTRQLKGREGSKESKVGKY